MFYIMMHRSLVESKMYYSMGKIVEESGLRTIVIRKCMFTSML